MSEFLVYLVTMAGIWGMLSLSLNVQFGLAGLVNLGHIAFFLLGAYTSTILVTQAGAPIFVGVAAGIVVAALFGILMALPTHRLQQDYWGISTLAAAEIVRVIALNTPIGGPFAGQAFGISGIPRPFREWFTAQGYSIAAYNLFYMAMVLVILALVVLFVIWLMRTPFARTLKALREDDAVPLALGKNVSSFRLRAMALGGGIAGLAGGLFAHFNGFIEPEMFRPVETFLIWAMVILGGAGSAIGAVVGTFLVMVIYTGTRYALPWIDEQIPWLSIDPQVAGSLRMVIIGVLIILVILFLPKGLVPERRRRYDR